jgi:DNA-binding Lrp family transcriptional regulator
MSNSTALHYPLTNAEWLNAVTELKPAELIVLYHLRTLTPFGDRPVSLGVREMARALNMNPGTVSRALKRLDVLEYIDLELLQVNVRVLSKGVLSTDNTVVCRQPTRSVDNTDDLQTTPAIARQHLNDYSDLKPAQSKGSKNGQVTNNRHKNFKETKTDPPTHPVSRNDQERIGALLEMVEAVGIKPNKTIQKVLEETIATYGTGATRRVELALEAVEEQRQQGSVKNIGGLVVDAIRRGYTPNQYRPPEPPDPIHVSQTIDHALLAGDRSWALARLQQLWNDGCQEEIRELCKIRRDWGFQVGSGGVSDADG